MGLPPQWLTVTGKYQEGSSRTRDTFSERTTH